MPFLPKKLVEILDRFHWRMVRERRGSVLILVVVLVVLLALLGTATLSTTRGDRYTVVKNSENTQVDLMVEGAIQMAVSAINGGVYGDQKVNGSAVGSSVYRPAGEYQNGSVGLTSSYANFDGYYLAQISAGSIAHDGWLSPRTPRILSGDNNLVSASANVSIMDWPCIGILPGVDHFDSPYSVYYRSTADPNNYTIDPTIPTTYTDRVTLNKTTRMTPNFFTLVGTSTAIPAWTFPYSATGSNATQRFVVAGDADGDGIADSGFIKISPGDIDGITYYAAIRIIDNNSAINVNTAGSRTSDYDPDGLTKKDTLGTDLSGPTTGENNLGTFRSHVGLRELMIDPDNEFAAISAYRGVNPSGQMVDDQQNMRSEAFVSLGDALEHQVASRMLNPGYASTANKFKTFSATDASSLAGRFTIRSLDVIPSLLEQVVNQRSVKAVQSDSFYEGAPNFPLSTNLSPVKNRSKYDASQIDAWYDDNFDFERVSANTTAVILGHGGASPLRFKMDRAFNGSPIPIRAITTTYNPVSNEISPRTSSPGNATMPVPAGMKPYRPNSTVTTGLPAKTNINTAPFEELWRAFWSVMTENGTQSGTPFTGEDDPANLTSNLWIYTGMDFDDTPTVLNGEITASQHFKGKDSHPQRMFRSSFRDPRPTSTPMYFSSREMMRLRSAMAAVQTLQLRDPTADIYKDVPFDLIEGPPSAPTKTTSIAIRIFGAKPQPFINEIFAWTDIATANTQGPGGGQPNTVPYVAIELYNPYNVDVVLDSSYRIATIDRSTAMYVYTPGTPTTLTTLYTFNTPVTIPANGYLVIDNSQEMNYIPPSAGQAWDPGAPPTGAQHISVNGLAGVLDKEMIIVRDPATGPTGPANQIRPIDSYDFTNLRQSNPLAYAWHYARHNQTDNRWGCVYPGRYIGSKSDIGHPRHQGTDWAFWDTTQQNVDPWPNTPPDPFEPTLGEANDKDGTHQGTLPAALPIPLGGLEFPNPLVGGTAKYPYGGFMRNGDIMSVPFIAACNICDLNTTPGTPILVDLNSISMDSAFAEDTDVTDDFPKYATTVDPPVTDVALPREQVGRFCPLIVGGASAADPPVIDDLDLTGAYVQTDPTLPRWNYRWATRLFDYLTVQSPGTDTLPNVPNTTAGYTPNPAQVDNDGDGKKGIEDDATNSFYAGLASSVGLEDGVPVQGLININTASWKVLSAIPWVPAGNDNYKFVQEDAGRGWEFLPGQDGLDDNETIARAIVYWRDGDPSKDPGLLGDGPNPSIAPAHGPFRSLYDLYSIRFPCTERKSTDFSNVTYLFRKLQEDVSSVREPGNKDGDFTPYGTGDTDHSRFDFEEMNLILTKVSNLLTVRSDSFTVYIQVQGWRNVGTAKPTLYVERRTAFIQDRSGVTRVNKNLPAKVNMPTN